MKNKFLLGLSALLAVALIPLVSLSKENSTDTVVLSAGDTLVLNSEVNGESVGAIIVKAKELDAKLAGPMGLNHKAPLYLYLNTPGGSIESGLQLIEALKGLGRPVHTVTYFAASMGFQIAQNLDSRYILKSGTLMSHRAAGSFEGSFGGTSPSQLDQRVHYFTQVTREMDEQTVSRTNGKQTLESYQKSYSSELWMTGAESIKGGYADQIIKVKCGKDLLGTTQHQTEFLGMPVTYELDNCPINTAPLNVKVGGTAGASQEYLNRVKTQFVAGYTMKLATPLPLVL